VVAHLGKLKAAADGNAAGFVRGAYSLAGRSPTRSMRGGPTASWKEIDRGKNDRWKYTSVLDRVRLLGPALEINMQDMDCWVTFFATFLPLQAAVS
jgi:hypothetical protein